MDWDQEQGCDKTLMPTIEGFLRKDRAGFSRTIAKNWLPLPHPAHPRPSLFCSFCHGVFVSMETRCCTGRWAQNVFPWKRVKYLGGLTSLSVDEGATLLMERYPARFHHLLSIKPYVKHIEKWDILQINWLNRISSNNSSFQNIFRSNKYIQPFRT